MNLKIIQTSDGSDTIYNSELNETYHSLHGSVNESNTVYIQNGLEYYIKKKSRKKINILEDHRLISLSTLVPRKIA